MVDIIIPVYNAYEYLQSCIKSIFRYTESKSCKYRIIIINDKSTDIRVSDYLKSLKSKAVPNLVVFENNENLGFVATVNRGMRLSKHNDVVLLNSDTEVTTDWLDKLHKCAYSNTLIATVTPLSNNATICSIPKFGVDNVIPKGYSVQDFSHLVERKSLELYPEIPTGVGFCMYIKRNVLDMIGYFDGEHFKKGYGEENDFCMRVKNVGLINVLDDTTFIYHKGSASFTDQRKRDIQTKQLKVLERLHPGYSKLIEDFLTENPLYLIHKNINFWLDFYKNSKRSILYVKHFESSIGGVGLHIKDLIDHLRNYNILLLHEFGDDTFLLEYWFNGIKLDEWKFKINKYSARYAWIKELVIDIIKYFDIDIVHFHHLLGYPLNILDIPRRLRVKSLLSCHDLFIVDESIFLRKNERKKSIEFYQTVESYLNDIGEKDVKKHRIKYIKNLLKSIDKVITPSEFFSNSIKKVFKMKKVKTIEHGISFKKVRFIEPVISKKINIAFLGVPAMHKGILDFMKLIKNDSIRDKFNWSLIGYDDFYRKYLPDLFKFKDALKIIETYKREDLPSILKDLNINIVLVMSKCLESFSYTLSESIQCNVPVIGKNIGVVGDRIKEKDLGWTYDSMNDLISLLEGIDNDREQLKNKIREISEIKMKTIAQSVDEYKYLYDKMVNERDIRKSKLPSKVNKHFQLCVINKQKTEVQSDEVKARKFLDRAKRNLKKIPIIRSTIPIFYRIIKKW